MVTELASRFDSIVESFGPLCVGIDPSSETLTRFGLKDSANGAVELSRRILDGATDRVGIVKPQVAFFERFGSEGFIALEEVIRDAHERGLSVIADAKRGDLDGIVTAEHFQRNEQVHSTGILDGKRKGEASRMGRSTLEFRFRRGKQESH